MRQTSRAVALLLAVESAQAALTAQAPTLADDADEFYYTTVFYPAASDANAPTGTMQLNSRTAGFVWSQRTFGATATIISPTMQLNTVAYQQAVAKATYDLSIAIPGSSCVQCIGAGAVWCSRTYTYVETAPSASQAKYNYELTDAKISLMSIQITTNFNATEPAQQAGPSKDQGSCCWSQSLFNKFIGNQGAQVVPTQPANDTQSATDGVDFVEASCVALKQVTADATITDNKFLTMQIDDLVTRNSSWWCSNGLYKKIYLNNVTPTVVLNSQQIIGQGINKRKELAMVGCPQKTLMCGNGADTAGTIITLMTATETAVPITVLAADLTVNDKCTWVGQAMLAAPTFKLGGSDDADLGVTTSNWLIHAMEYTATAAGTQFAASSGSLATAGTSADLVGYEALTSGLTYGTYIPKFTMPAEQFATLRTWYGEPTVAGALDTKANLPAAWLSPGQAPVDNSKAASKLLASAPTESYGNVVNVPFSTISTQTGSVNTVGDTNYGLYNAVPFDLRQARYFPAKVAQTVHAAGLIQDGKYTTATANYATAKTAWDNYVALLEKNAKTDAFAALFSPPKSPTVPPLPSMPWLPATYAGYVYATPEQQNLYNLSSTASPPVYAATTSPTAQQIWTNITAAQTVGGWGSFTAQVLRYRNLWGKSFGTIGYSGAATNDLSAVWNYKWTCATTDEAKGPGTTPCDATYGGSNANPSTTPGAENTTVSLISVVSLWSTANKMHTSGSDSALIDIPAFSVASTFKLTWTPKAWSGSLVALTAIAAPVAATAAKGLSGVAGAQALAATSAAALAVAAALY